MDIVKKAAALITEIKTARPIVHQLTNYVTMNDCANVILAIGGSPIMANAVEEIEEVTKASKALVLNMGTPGSDSLRAMLLAGTKAKEAGIPVIFDPVGAGATGFRKEICRRVVSEIRPEIIKGNHSEILYISGMKSRFCGIDSSLKQECSSGLVRQLAGELKCIVVATGRTDVISDGQSSYTIDNGHEMLSRITGAGCMTGSLTGAFCSVSEDRLAAALGGVLTMGVAGSLAHRCLQQGEGIGTFKLRLFDSIYNLDHETLLREGKVNEVQDISGLFPVSDNR